MFGLNQFIRQLKRRRKEKLIEDARHRQEELEEQTDMHWEDAEDSDFDPIVNHHNLKGQDQ